MKESLYDPYREQKRLEKIWRILFDWVIPPVVSIAVSILTVLMVLKFKGYSYMDLMCDSLVAAFCSAVWDPDEITKNVRLDDGTSDIDSLDAFEYTIERYITKLIKYE